MAKKKEKSAAKEEVTPVQDGEPEEAETGDDQSPEAYTLTGDFTADLNEIFKRSAVEPIPVRQRGVVAASMCTVSMFHSNTLLLHSLLFFRSGCV